MPPRGGRGRGRGGSRVAKSTPRSNRAGRNSFGGKFKINGHSYDQNDTNGVHAIFEPPGLLIVAGLLPEHFPDYDSERDGESDSHSDYGSATTKTLKKHQQAPKERMQDAERASNPGNDGDWTETDIEVFVAPKTRGFYRPPPRREVVRQRVRKSESSRYNDAIPKVRKTSPPENAENDEEPSRRSSQKSSNVNEELPIIVEQEATEDKPDVRVRTVNVRDSGRRGRRKVYVEPEAPRPQMIDEGELSDSNFPDAYLEKVPAPPLRQCEDKADWIMKKRFAPMGDPQAFIAALTKLDPATRSTDALFDIALNAQRAIRAWQDEYLKLDLITAPKSNPPKKPLTGGRATIDPQIYDDMLEADLYGYTYDGKKQPGQQDPFRQRAGGGKFVGGRELRQRRGRDVGAVDLSEPGIDSNEGYGTRRRRAAQRQNNNQLEVPSRRGVKRVNSNGTSDYDGPPRKRGRPSIAEKNLMQSRVQQLREESLAVSNSSEPDGRSPEPSRRRGRPPGSRNTMPRSDAGVKKGPRKLRFLCAPGGSEDASQSGLVDRADAKMPVSHPSGQDSMDVDEVAPAAVNGTSAHATAEGRTGSLNGEPAFISAERANTSTSTPTPAADLKDPKKRVRSEKRSKSMTEWWAARKAKEAEDRKLQLARQAEADRQAEEQARAAHAAHQAQFPPQKARYWPQIAPQHPQQAYPGPPPPVPHVSFTGPQPSKDSLRGPPQRAPQLPPPPQHAQPQGPPPASREEPQHVPPPLPAGTPQGLPMAGPPPPPQQPPPPHHHHHPHVPPPIPHDQGPPPSLSQGTIAGPPPGPPPVLHHSQPPHRPPSVSFARSPAQTPQQHVFHHHPAPPPPPPTALQFSPPPPHAQGPNRQPSPLRRIINYVSDPSKAAQPAGPPYQTIMTPGTSSPTVFQHHGYQLGRPSSRGRTPPSAAAAGAGSFMSAFHINNTAGRPPIPGTGSFCPDTPGKSTFTHYTVYTPPALQRGPQVRMMGAQVQDLALAAVQPAVRKPTEDVLREQRARNASPPPQPTMQQPGRERGFLTLQPAPDHSRNEGGAPPPDLRAEHEQRPSAAQQDPRQSGTILPALPGGVGKPSSQGPADAAFGPQQPAALFDSPAPPATPAPRQQLPPLISFTQQDSGVAKSMRPTGAVAAPTQENRHRSISTSLGQPLRIVPAVHDHGQGEPKGGSVV